MGFYRGTVFTRGSPDAAVSFLQLYRPYRNPPIPMLAASAKSRHANLGHTCIALNGYSQSSVNADRFHEGRGVRRKETAGHTAVDGA